MQGISFGSTNLPYQFGAAQLGTTQGLSGNHGTRSRCGNDQSASQSSDLSTYALNGILANLSSSIANLSSQLGSLSSSNTDGTNAISASAMGAQIINKQRGELQIHTQEGDVVTLKFSSKVGVSIEGQQVSDGDTTLTNTSLDVHGRSKIGISVEGDLSDEEMAAINDLVGKVGDLTNDFFNGDVESALSQAMSLSYDSTVLADYSLDLSLKQSVRTYAYAAQWSPPATATPATDNSATDAAAADATTPVVAADETTPASSTTDASAPTTNDTTTPAATDSTATTSSNPTQVLAAFVAKVRSSFHVSATDSSMGISYEFKAKLLIASLAQSAPAEASPNEASLNYLQDQLGASTTA
ncbi:MAG: hypothetical protein QM808_14785 [Steroidobacteraceae bacterium]